MNTITHPDFSNLQLSPILAQAFDLFRPDQRLAAIKIINKNAIEISKARADNTITEITLQIMAEVDSNMNEQVDWPKISCKAGCAHCCRIKLDISEGEAKVLVDYARANDIEIDTGVLKYQEKLSKEQRPISKLPNCVFLSADEKCKVYAARPFNCRKYLVQTEPKYCDAVKFKKQIVGVNFNINTELLVSSYNSAIDQPMGNMSTMLLAELSSKK